MTSTLIDNARVGASAIKRSDVNITSGGLTSASYEYQADAIERAYNIAYPQHGTADHLHSTAKRNRIQCYAPPTAAEYDVVPSNLAPSMRVDFCPWCKGRGQFRAGLHCGVCCGNKS